MKRFRNALFLIPLVLIFTAAGVYAEMAKEGTYQGLGVGTITWKIP